MPSLERKNNQMVLSNDFKVVLDERDPYEITYKGAIELPIHRWVRLTPSFSPHLVSALLKEFKCDRSSKILDPFMGVGTTVLQCQFEGLYSIGVDINPFFHYVVAMKTSLWQKDLTKLRTGVHDFTTKISETRKAQVSLDDLPRAFGIQLPKLHNITRWWRKDVLKDLLMTKHVLESDSFEEDVREFLRMGLISILIDVANVTYEGVQFTFIDRSTEVLDVFVSINQRLCEMLEDVDYFKRNASRLGKAASVLGDSTHLSDLLKKENRPTCVITSPPYPNRYSYVWNTRPYLYFFDFFSKPSEAAELDNQSIGGTWGKATSDLVKGKVAPLNSDVAEIVETTVDKIRSKNNLKNTNLMANYVMKYFNMMYQHIRSLREVLDDDANVAYVIGNSEIKGIEIPSDIWLGKIMEKSNLTVDRIVRVRRRHSGKTLYEAIVIGRYA